MKRFWSTSKQLLSRSYAKVWLCALGVVAATLLIAIVFPLSSTTAEKPSNQSRPGTVIIPSEAINGQLGTQVSQGGSSIIQGARPAVTSPPISYQSASQTVVPLPSDKPLFCPEQMDGHVIDCQYCTLSYYSCSPCSPRLLGRNIVCALD